MGRGLHRIAKRTLHNIHVARLINQVTPHLVNVVSASISIS